MATQHVTIDFETNAIAVMETLDDGGQTRRVLWPGNIDDQGTWLSTDLASEDPAVQALAAAYWTPAVVAGYQEAAEAAASVQRAAYEAQKAAALKLLPRWRFDAQLEISGLGTSLDQVIGEIPDVTKRAVVRARLSAADPVNRDDPEFSDEDLLGAMNMAPADIDAFWQAAWALAEPGSDLKTADIPLGAQPSQKHPRARGGRGHGSTQRY